MVGVVPFMCDDRIISVFISVLSPKILSLSNYAVCFLLSCCAIGAVQVHAENDYDRLLFSNNIEYLQFVKSLNHVPDNPVVLLLNSYHPNYQWTENITDGVREGLKDVVPTENLHIEYMDNRRFAGDAIFNEKMKSLMAYKFKTIQPDVVITSDDAAFNFYLQHGETLFPGVPLVFCGVNVFDPSVLNGKPNVTGIVEGMDIEGNIQLIQSVQPSVNHIVMLSDKTELGQRMTMRAQQIIHLNDSNGLKMEVIDDFTYSDLRSMVQSASKNSAFLILAVHKDKQGQYFSFEEQLPALSEVSRVPIYGMWGAMMIGNGIVGGNVNDPYKHGKNAARLASRVLAAGSAKGLGVIPNSEFSPQFDYQQLLRFNIPVSRLPNGATLFGYEAGFYSSHHLMINSGVILIIGLTTIIWFLIKNIHRRERAEKDLTRLNESLESIVEDRTQDLEIKNRQLTELSNRYESMAFTDILTELGNRRFGNELLQKMIKRHQLSQQYFSIGLVDIDHFKKVNDTYGHDVGDIILKSVSRTILDLIRPTDTICRWGGEEFLLFFPGSNAQSAERASERIRTAISSVAFAPVGSVTISIGVAQLLSHDDGDAMLKRADKGLYMAKDCGRNHVVAV